MLAVQLTEWGRPPVVREIDDPAPTGEQLLIKVGAAGLCRSDLSVMDSPTDRFDYPLPLTLGHEVAGTVVDTGPDGDHTLLGKDVVVHGIWSCRAIPTIPRRSFSTSTAPMGTPSISAS